MLRANFKVIVNLAACRGLAADTTRAAITEMNNQGAVMIDNAEALLLA